MEFKQMIITKGISDMTAKKEAIQDAVIQDIIRLKNTVPVLRIFDVEKATGFYVDFLGFKLDWQHRFGENYPLYLQVSKDQCILHLTEHHGDASPGSSLRIHCSNVGQYQQLLHSKDYRFAKPDLNKTSWGTEEFQLTDPFFNRLIFWQDIENQT
jgi:hypothetical protein